MLNCFKDAHIEHIVNENTLNLIMGYCDETGDGEIIARSNCNEVAMYLNLLRLYLVLTFHLLAMYRRDRLQRALRSHNDWRHPQQGQLAER